MLFGRGGLRLLVLGLGAWPATATAGGFDIADHGAQAMGRGGAFVAKADDPTAIHANPAGLARQRGTKAFAGGNLYLHSFEFRRAGTFPDDPKDPSTPWGGRPFPAVTNSGGPFFTPFLAATSDLGLDRLTLGAAFYGSSAIGNRTFPFAIDGAPASSRYDYVQSRSTIWYPTVSLGLRVTRWLDLGASGHVLVANFDESDVTYVDTGRCGSTEYQPCDSRGTLTAMTTTFAGTFGALVRPTESLGIGASVRTPIGLTAEGAYTPEPPLSGDVQLAQGAASIYTNLPLVARAGARYVSMDASFEVYDLELDVVYENWAAAQREGPVVIIPRLGDLESIYRTVVHRYHDTYSIRGGGAYNFEAGRGVVAIRAGSFFETPATDHATTRVDYDTLAKVAGTAGIGYRNGPFSVDLAYAAIASIPRVVGAGVGEVRALDDARGGRPIDNSDQPLPAVNEGAYRGFTHLLSAAMTVRFDGLLGHPRRSRYGNPYEADFAGDEAPAAAPEPPAAEPPPPPAGPPR